MPDVVPEHNRYSFVTQRVEEFWVCAHGFTPSEDCEACWDEPRPYPFGWHYEERVVDEDND